MSSIRTRVYVLTWVASRGVPWFHVRMRNAQQRPRGAQQGIKLHSIPETAELLGGCSDMHVYRLIASGELRAVDIATKGAGRSKSRVRSDDLADYIDRKTRGRTA
jgi:excisionase family DNA binding protein